MRFSAAFLCAVALVTVACGGSNSDTSPSTTPAASNTERFDAILVPRSSAFYSFNVSSNGSIAVNLASLSPIARPGVLPVAMELGYGVPAGEDCNVRKSVQTGTGFTSQLTDTVSPGIYCANIKDVGNLNEPANFSIRITHP
jgi:hypothetical protein